MRLVRRGCGGQPGQGRGAKSGVAADGLIELS